MKAVKKRRLNLLDFQPNCNTHVWVTFTGEKEPQQQQQQQLFSRRQQQYRRRLFSQRRWFKIFNVIRATITAGGYKRLNPALGSKSAVRCAIIS